MNTTKIPWTQDDELIVASDVLASIRKNTSRDDVFKELESKLEGRTAGAVKLRWYKHIAPRFRDAIILAEKQALSVETIDQEIEENTEEVPSIFNEEELSKINKELDTIFEEDNVEEVIVPESIVEQSTTQEINNLTMEKVIDFLKNQSGSSVNNEEFEQLKLENEQLKLQNQKLHENLEQLGKENEALREDYAFVSKIMAQARDMFDSDNEKRGTVYKTDRKGNVLIEK